MLHITAKYLPAGRLEFPSFQFSLTHFHSKYNTTSTNITAKFKTEK